MSQRSIKRGAMAWMAANPVAANLLMVVMLVGGLMMATQTQQEVFPYFEVPNVTVSVTVSGATPEEMEKSVALSIEEAVQGIDGVDEVTATIRSGSASIKIEGTDDVDGNVLLQDVKAAVDRITTFPEEADSPVVSLASSRRQVITLVLSGEDDLQVLRYWADIIKEDLIQDNDITQAEVGGVRDHEVWVEVPQNVLRRYGLTVSDVANAIGNTAIQQGSGTVRASSGDIMLRLNERRDYADEFANVAVRTNADGSRLLLDDIATIRDTFDESTRWSEFNDRTSVPIFIYSLSGESPNSVAAATKKIVARFNSTMPGELKLHIRDDMAKIYQQRVELLSKNAFQGVLLVFLFLALFLRPSQAFWVSLGIPISILGAFWFFNPFGLSINMITLFAFIITLGIVVDDAIVVGENVSAWQERGKDPLEAAVYGAREVGIPVVFSVLTNIISFLPMLFIPGTMGKIWSAIPLVVIAVFTCSLIESLFVLPAHLVHVRKFSEEDLENDHSFMGKIRRNQHKFSIKFMAFVQNKFGPFVTKVLHKRYVTFAIGIAILLFTFGYVSSGRMGFDLMPRVESDYAYAEALLPSGAPKAQIERVKNRIVNAAKEVIEKNGGDGLSTGIFVKVEDTTMSVFAYLVDPEIRPMSTMDFTNEWRKAVGVIPGVESLVMQADRGGPSSGSALTVRLSHRDTDVLELAAADLGERLVSYSGVGDIDTGTSRTTRQFDVSLTPAAEQLGFSAADVSRQLRNAFEGALALRQQRGNNEVTVKVRLPEEDRARESTFEEFILRSPQGQEVLLRDIVEINDGRADSVIRHTNGRRTATVTANISPSSETGRMMSTIEAEIMPQMMADYSGLSWEFGGRQSDMKDSTTAMIYGLIMALMGIYALLAIPFKSYTQPLIIMFSIPFGIVGAVAGHVIMGYSLSVISLFGVVALSGVVVNDSLVLIDFANRARREHNATAFEAVTQAAIQRFRPILLTTITTFVGLAPIIFETSRQARFLIPVALSLGFGILFATFICLLLVPALYLILDDVTSWFNEKFNKKIQNT